MVLGAPLGVLLAATISWRAAFGLVAVLAAVTVLGLRWTNAGTGPVTGRPRANGGAAPMIRSTMLDRLRPMRSSAVVGALGVTFLVMTASNSTYTYLALLLLPRLDSDCSSECLASAAWRVRGSAGPRPIAVAAAGWPRWR
jgi:predicted MFS family arabinose efflux permease